MAWIAEHWQLILGWGGSTTLVVGAIIGSSWKATIKISNDVGLYVGTANARLDNLEAGQRAMGKRMDDGFTTVHTRIDNHLERRDVPRKAGATA